MSALLAGYARCSTDQQDLTAQREALPSLGVEAESSMELKTLMMIHPGTVAAKVMAARSHHLRVRTRIAQYKKPTKDTNPKPQITARSHALCLLRQERL